MTEPVEPTKEDKEIARAWYDSDRPTPDQVEKFGLTKGREDDIVWAFSVGHATGAKKGAAKERAWHRMYLERVLKMSKHVPGSAMLKAFLESTLEHLAKREGA